MPRLRWKGPRGALSSVTAMLLSFGIPATSWADRLTGESLDVLRALSVADDSHTPYGGDDLVGLKPELRRILDDARREATAEGVDLLVVSAHRSTAEQQRIWEYSVGKYGSESEAIRWVLPPNLSAHVTGEAIDVLPEKGARWLQAHAAELGLCRRYANEWWHFERTASLPGGTCRLEPYAGWLLSD